MATLGMEILRISKKSALLKNTEYFLSFYFWNDMWTLEISMLEVVAFVLQCLKKGIVTIDLAGVLRASLSPLRKGFFASERLVPATTPSI